MSAPHRDRELAHFLLLTPQEQKAAIERLAAQRMSPSTIAAATGLSREFVETLIGPQPPVAS